MNLQSFLDFTGLTHFLDLIRREMSPKQHTHTQEDIDGLSDISSDVDIIKDQINNMSATTITMTTWTMSDFT